MAGIPPAMAVAAGMFTSTPRLEDRELWEREMDLRVRGGAIGLSVCSTELLTGNKLRNYYLTIKCFITQHNLQWLKMKTIEQNLHHIQRSVGL